MNIFKKFFSHNVKSVQGKVEYIIVGLGNPGARYDNTRHNVGFMALDYISKNLGVSVSSSKFDGLYTICEISGKKTMLLKPQTFMNESGKSVLKASEFYKIPHEKIIILLDDINIEIGKLRIRRKGSHGGQNGMKSIINLCSDDKFPRIKIGISNKPNPEWDLSDWVLSKFNDSEIQKFNMTLENIKKSVELIIDDKIDEAMSRYNHSV